MLQEVSSTMDCLTYCTTALIIFLSLFYAYAKYRLSYWSRRGVKSPPTHLLFGNFKDCITLKKPPGEIMREIYNSADPDDPYIGFYIFHKPLLLLRDHDLIKQVMIKDFDIFPNRRFGSGLVRDSVGLDSILSMQQPSWKYVRNKLTPALTGQKLKNMIPLMVECGKPMLNFIEKLPTNEAGWNEHEVKNISSRFSTDILASVTFGININSFNEESVFLKNGLKIFRGFRRGVIFIIQFFIPEWDFLIAPFIKEPANYLRKIFWDSMNSRERLAFNRGDLIDSMLALKNGEQNPIYKFEGDNLLAQPSSLYIAGFEASSTTTAFVLYDLARHPEHQETIYKEIQTHLSGKELTMDLINELSFLHCVVTESLRLHPPLPVTDRITTRNYKLPGTTLIIEKNVPVYVSINATNQDPKYFFNPQDFIPLRTEKDQNKFYESLAFGIGPRSCIGQRIALMIVKMAVITILSNYIMSYKPKIHTSDNDAIHVFTYASDGLHLQFKKRN